MELRWYQKEAVQAVWDYFKSGATGNPVLALPTGTGKSVVIAELIRQIFFYFPNQRVMVLTHRKKLVQQNAAKLREIWPHAKIGIYSAALNKRDTRYPITFAGIDSVMNRAHEFGHIDIVKIDEAHLVDDKENSRYQKFLAALRAVNPKLKVIGLSATAWRPKIGYITNGDIFTDFAYNLCEMSSFNRLVHEGYLCPLIPPKTDLALDLTGVHVVRGEFNESELQEAVDKDDITRAALHECLEKGSDRNHWMVFGTGVQHCINICNMLNELGVSAVVVHSKQSDAANDANIDAFCRGEYRAIVSMGVLTTGFDAPFVDMIVMLRPTMSSSLWVQMLGRGTRPHESKINTLVLDFARNVVRLGPINDPVIPQPKTAGGPKPAPIKECPQCFMYNHASARHCFNCGYEFKFETKLEQVAGGHDLIRDDTPVIEVFKVTAVTYNLHAKEGKTPSMKVTYTCGLRMFSEYVCVQHEGFARRKANDWWAKRSAHLAPLTVDEALQFSDELRLPTHLRIWINKKYPEIMAYDFDGTAFGTQEPDTAVVTTPTVVNEQYADDIPF